MAKAIKLKKGLDIRIHGVAPSERLKRIIPASCAVVPDDYQGITPKIDVKEGDAVLAGSVLFHDKQYPDVKVVSPVAGTIQSVVRGERRKLERIVIIPSQTPEESKRFDTSGIDDSVLAQRLLLDSGLWAWMRQRPFNIVPAPGTEPRDIMVTGFDSSPLAPDYEMSLDGHKEDINAAVRLLGKFTKGNIYIGIRRGSCLTDIKGAETIIFDGPHPAGNAGIQIANINPVNKGDVVWTLDAVTLMRIGHLVNTGTLDMNADVAVTGCEVKTPGYINTIAGADIASLTEGNIHDDNVHHRIISGNVLTGHPVGKDSYLRFPYNHITVIPEGDDHAEFMGWASLSPQKMSVSRSFPGHFTKRLFCPDARILGGRRAMIMSGLYDKVLPMDIMAEFLIKAVISRNIDRMEQLGIYEVAPEDFALCEYVDPSKLELQKILQEGLEYIRKELN